MSGHERLRGSSDPVDREIASFLEEARADVPPERLANVAGRLGLGAGAAGDAGGSGGAAGPTAGAGAAEGAGGVAGGLGMGVGAKVALGVLLGVTAVGLVVSWRAAAPLGEVPGDARAPSVDGPVAAPAAPEPEPEPEPEAAAEPAPVLPSEPDEAMAAESDPIAPPPVAPRVRPSRAAAVDGPRPPEPPRDPGSEPRPESAPASEPAPSSATEPSPAPPERAAPPVTTEGPPPAAEPPSEASLLARARRTLDRDPAAALAAVREHARLYPEGILAQEREVLRVETLVRLDRKAEARAALASFLARWPGSPHRARLRALVD